VADTFWRAFCRIKLARLNLESNKVSLECLKFADSISDRVQVLIKQIRRRAAGRCAVVANAHQVSDFGERKSNGLPRFNELNPGYRILVIVAVAVEGSRRLWK